MKILLICRHAKAEKETGRGDHARALTARGARDATAMGQHLARVAGVPDLIVTSDARRAEQTAGRAATALGYPGAIQQEPRIYQASGETLVQIVRQLPDTADCVLLVGHNPGCEELGQLLAPAGAPLPALPTAGVIHLAFAVPHWQDIRPAGGTLRGVYTL
ncbi:MAG TPA: histidine phosphatase family protein [Chloroflexia bacterium]|nr:histidine phosphatase family protein [Chloroflexia bacterium]